MRYLGIDYGDRQIGLAAGSIDTGLAARLPVLKSHGWERDIRRIIETLAAENIGAIVIGLPLNMDGTEGKRAEITRKFGALLEDASGLNVIYHDERLTSREATSLLLSQGYSRQRIRPILDSVSARLILEDYFRTCQPKQ